MSSLAIHLFECSHRDQTCKILHKLCSHVIILIAWHLESLQICECFINTSIFCKKNMFSMFSTPPIPSKNNTNTNSYLHLQLTSFYQKMNSFIAIKKWLEILLCEYSMVKIKIMSTKPVSWTACQSTYKWCVSKCSIW